MASHSGPDIIEDGLVLALDAANTKSYGGSGTTWSDLSGKENDGTINGSPSYTSTSPKYFTFGSNSKYIQISNDISNVSEGTFIAWIKRNGTQNGWAGIIGGRDSTYSAMHFGGSGVNLRYSWNSDHWGWDSGLLIPDGEWCMCAISISTSSGIAYVCQSSGIESATNSASHSSTTIGDIEIARDDYSSSRWYDGDISQVSIYNKALTAAEITQNFNALRRRYNI